jgi:microcompartment protein CcmL/EutN
LETPLVWIILRPVEGDPPYELASVTADPAEGEAMTETGTNLVEAVVMPKPMQETIAAFVAEHHVEQVFVKRKRDRANPEALARRGPPIREDRK